jgi:hypothetical protein
MYIPGLGSVHKKDAPEPKHSSNCIVMHHP